MFCKCNGQFVRVEREEDESYEDHHMRSIFIIKNLGKLDFNSLVGYSHIFKNMIVLGCIYSEGVKNEVVELSRNLYIK